MSAIVRPTPVSRDRAASNFSVASVFGVLTLLGVDAFVLSRVPWHGVLGWPGQLWHFLLAASVLVILLFSAREAAVVAIFGALAGCMFYGELWHYLARQGLVAEIAWYVLYIGLHSGGLLAGIYSCLEGRIAVGRVSVALILLSIAMNLAYCMMQGAESRFYCPLPPVELPHEIIALP